MNIGQTPSFTDVASQVFYGTGVATEFTLRKSVNYTTTIMVFLSGVIQNDGFTIVNNTTLRFDVAPALNTRIVVYYLYGFFASPFEVADGTVNTDKLAPEPLKSYSALDLNAADQVAYSIDGSTFGKFSINQLTKDILSCTTNLQFANTLDLLIKADTQTVTGVKTFSTAIVTPREPITWMSKSGHSTQMIMRGGKLYSTCGTNGAQTTINTGRGDNGTVPCYGIDNFKEIPLPTHSPIVSVGMSGAAFSYALLANGDLYVWGYNGGSCGLGHTAVVPLPTLTNTNVVEVFPQHGSNGGFDQYNASALFIRKTDGYIYGCGANGNGQLGIGSGVGIIPSWTQITNLGTNVSKIFKMGSSGGVTFAQKTDDTIWVAGYGVNGQLGTGNTSNQLTFVNVTTQWQGGTGWKIEQIVGGYSYYTTAADYSGTTVMLLKNGAATKVLTSGANIWGTCGDGTRTQRVTPYLIPSSGSVAKIAGAGGSPCTIHMLNTDGSLYAWGHNDQGQVGNGGVAAVNSPVQIFASGVTDILSDGMDTYSYSYNHATFIKKTDGVYATGINDAGYCGVGHTTNLTSFTKCAFPGDADVVDMGWYTTESHAFILLARTSDHRLFGWGNNTRNGVHDKNTVNVLVPTQARLYESI